MIIDVWLKKAINNLESISVPTARLDAEVLLSDELMKDRTWLHAHPDHKLYRPSLIRLNKQIERRMTHEPLAYIRGIQEFYGRDFTVSPDTLTPRPETETLLGLLFQHVKDWNLSTGEKLHIVDVGTGSGCIIITAALELAKLKKLTPNIFYTGLDISDSALRIAKQNAKKLNVKVKFKQFNLLKDDLSLFLNPRSSVCVLANLPYVPNEFHINLAASHEPGFAIFGGRDGLDYYRLLFKKAFSSVEIIITESLPSQHTALENIAKNTGYSLIDHQDLIQYFRVDKSHT